MKVRVTGNHSSYHCGCVAVWQVLVAALKDNGCQISEDDDFDALVINGEGSMHHGRSTFRRKMSEAADALDSGKSVFLVNSVWDDNPSEFDHVLRRLSGICVREGASERELAVKHHVNASVCLDFSYFFSINADTQVSSGSNEYFTDYLEPTIGNFNELPYKFRSGRKEFSLSDLDWRQAVETLSNATLLVTGRHHAVYAACRARTPFAALEGNSHKISGLIATSGIPIPIAQNVSELGDVIEWCRNNREQFEMFFDWMDLQASRCHPRDILPKT